MNPLTRTLNTSGGDNNGSYANLWSPSPTVFSAYVSGIIVG